MGYPAAGGFQTSTSASFLLPPPFLCAYGDAFSEVGKVTYKVIITEADGKVRRKETNSRREALFYAESFSCPMKVFDFGNVEGHYVEVVDGKGIRIYDAAVPQGSEWALAWRDSRRTWVRGFRTREEAEEAMKEVAGKDAVVLRASQRLPWSVGPGYTKPIHDREKFEEEIRENGGFIVGEDEGPLSGTPRETS